MPMLGTIGDRKRNQNSVTILSELAEKPAVPKKISKSRSVRQRALKRSNTTDCFEPIIQPLAEQLDSSKPKKNLENFEDLGASSSYGSSHFLGNFDSRKSNLVYKNGLPSVVALPAPEIKITDALEDEVSTVGNSGEMLNNISNYKNRYQRVSTQSNFGKNNYNLAGLVQPLLDLKDLEENHKIQSVTPSPKNPRKPVDNLYFKHETSNHGFGIAASRSFTSGTSTSKSKQETCNWLDSSNLQRVSILDRSVHLRLNEIREGCHWIYSQEKGLTQENDFMIKNYWNPHDLIKN